MSTTNPPGDIDRIYRELMAIEPWSDTEPQGPELISPHSDRGRHGVRGRGYTRPPLHKRKRRARKKASRKARKANRSRK